MQEKLKPCPFCGGDARLVGPERGFMVMGWYCLCKDCGVTGERDTDKEEAVKHWNRRTPEEKAMSDRLADLIDEAITKQGCSFASNISVTEIADAIRREFCVADHVYDKDKTCLICGAPKPKESGDGNKA